MEDNWKHRSETMRCSTCMWFVEKASWLGRCRRRCPTMAGWPVIFLTDWCGDHKLDETRVPEKIRPTGPKESNGG